VLDDPLDVDRFEGVAQAVELPLQQFQFSPLNLLLELLPEEAGYVYPESFSSFDDLPPTFVEIVM
jgi:hypothetical protein